jgi:biopolymer transport protein ExbD
MLLMNTNREKADGVKTSTESTLPEIRLPEGTSKANTASSRTKSVTLSASKKGQTILYFIDNQSVDRRELATILRSRKVLSVKIRFDREIPYGDYINVLDLCTQAGVSNIENIYSTESLDGTEGQKCSD